MPTASSIPRQTVGKTFMVAVSLLGIGALAQFSAVSWAFYSRFRTTPNVALNESTSVAPISLGDPFGDQPILGTPMKPKPLLQFPYRPVPIIQEAPAAAPPESRFDELVAQARTLRDRGDTYTAITRLREAQALDPTDGMPMAEIALTYEKMGMADKAAEHWKKVYDLGEGAGVYYAAADAKLKASQAQAMLKAAPPAAPLAAAESAPIDQAAAEAAVPQNAKLGLGTIARQDISSDSQRAKFTLRVPLIAKPRARIDVQDVAIQVFFYDAVAGRTLERTNAEVTTRWSSPPPDWSDGDEETLEVTYAQPPPAQGDPTNERKFYGYVVRVYYKDALQDARAEPARLDQQFPAPRTLAQPDPNQ